MDRLKQAWVVIRANLVPLTCIALAYSFLDYSISNMMKPYFSNMSLATIRELDFLLVIILSWLLRVFFLTGFLPMVLVALDGGNLNVASFALFLNRKRLFNMFKLELVVVPIMIAGFFLLFIPGFIWIILVSMSYFIMAGDPSSKVLDSVSNSLKITSGFRLTLAVCIFLYGVLSFLSSLVPYLPPLLNTIFVVFYYVLLSLIYRDCVAKHAR